MILITGANGQLGSEMRHLLDEDFDCIEHKEREDEVRPLQVLAFHLPTTVDKEPEQ